MTRSTRALCALLAAAAVAAGCSSSPATPTSPTGGSGSLTLTADQVSGSWTVRALQPAGEALQPAPAGAVYTITFSDGRVSARTDCNTCSGRFTLDGTTLTVGPQLACTRAACPTMSFEAAYTRVLSGASTVTLADGDLVLSSPRGTLTLSR